MSAGLRRAWWRFGATLGAILLAGLLLVVLILESDPWTYRKSPLQWLDPSYGVTDPALCAALKAALVGERVSTERSWHEDGVPDTPDREMAPAIGELTDAEFRERVGSVAGWDALVVFQPYQLGSTLPRDPAIESWWLQRQIDHSDGQPQERYAEVLVIRDQQSVGTIVLDGELETTGVVARSR